MSSCGTRLAPRLAGRAAVSSVALRYPCSAFCSSTQYFDRDRRGDSWQGVALAGVFGASALFLTQLSHGPAVQCKEEKQAEASEDRLLRWRSTWSSLKPGKDPPFHSKATNRLLVKHLSRFIAGAPAVGDGVGPAVLVPLCGKSVDMNYFGEHSLSVVGVEGVGRAIMDFEVEQRCIKNSASLYRPFEQRAVCVKGFKMPKQVSLGPDGCWTESSGFEAAGAYQGSRRGFVFKKGNEGLGYYRDSPKVWKGRMVIKETEKEQPINIIQADIFDVTPELVDGATFVTGGTFHLAYDRAAFTTMAPKARRAYAEKLASLLQPGGRILLVAVEYDQSKVPHDPRDAHLPPFSVSANDLRDAFHRSSWEVEELDSESNEILEPVAKKEKDPNLSGVKVVTRVYLITKSAKGSSSLPSSGLGTAAIVGASVAAAGVATAVYFSR